jgi:hypothetical protein
LLVLFRTFAIGGTARSWQNWFFQTRLVKAFMSTEPMTQHSGRNGKLDTQLVELAGRNWLASELLRAGVEIARPERDRGIDLIAYVDIDERVERFVARPIQMKAATGAVFSLDPR